MWDLVSVIVFFFVDQSDRGLEFKLKYSRSNGDNEIGVNAQVNT
jgi:hypothetical protein